LTGGAEGSVDCVESFFAAFFAFDFLGRDGDLDEPRPPAQLNNDDISKLKNKTIEVFILLYFFFCKN
jgi:hypothetical protein